MIKKVLLLLLTLLTITATILVSCKSDTTTEEETETPPPVDSSSEKPQYGGTAYSILVTDLTTFDEAFGSQSSIVSLKLTNEEMLTGDWAKGPAGTNETNFIFGSINTMSLKTGSLADRWETPTKGVITFHIREGVRWHNKAPCNGRELTVDDVVFSFKRICTEPGAYIKQSYPLLASGVKITSDAAARTVTVDATACPQDQLINVLTYFPDYITIMPKDAIEQFGDMKDWKNSIGTGPYILTDFISNGSATYERNPDYWGTNPCGPGKGDKLPYLDGVKFLIITDTATALTAFRTMQINSYSGDYDDMKEFLENPDIKNMSYAAENCYCISMRTDKADLPFSKKEVRQALTLATDFNKIKNEYYSGKANILVWPISYVKEYADAYVPMEKLPASVQELYSYNPNKARELLTAAGYPTGFDATILCYNTPTFIDYLSLVQDMWSQIGVRLTLDTRNINTWTARIRAKNYDSMMYFYNSPIWYKMQNFTSSGIYNMSFVNDAYCNEQATKSMELFGVDDAAVAQMHADLMPYVLEQCWAIPKPNPYTFRCWWPWVKNYHGEISIGYYNTEHIYKYIWQDNALKAKMTGQ
jgi:peptide/nickel transport system substrate-binding protein